MNTSTRLRQLADRMGLDGFAEELREIAGELDAKAAPAVPQGNDPAWTLAAKVREALDRKACPGYYMDVAVEAVVHNYIYATSAQPAQRDPYTTIDLGHGKFEVGAGKNGGLPCIAFGRNGTGKVGEPITTGPRQMSVEETFAVITFANVTGLDVLQEKMDQVREEFFPGTTPQFSATPAPAPAVPQGEPVALTEVNELTDILIATWAKGEPDHSVTKYPASYRCTFGEMARAAIDALREKEGK